MKKHLSIIAAAMLSVSLTACETTGKKEPDIIVIDQRVPIAPPPVEPVRPQPVTWQVLNSQSILDLANRIEQTGENLVLFVLDSDGYRALSTNLVDIKRYIQEQNAAIKYVVDAANKPEEVEK